MLIQAGKSSKALSSPLNNPELNKEALSLGKVGKKVQKSPIATKATGRNSKADIENANIITGPENAIPPVGNGNGPEGRGNRRRKVPAIEPASEVELIAPRTTRSQKQKETEILNIQAKKKTKSTGK